MMDFVSYLTGITLLLTRLVKAQTPPAGPVEYCMTDEFKASCKRNEVIDIVSAVYGRMHIGKCVTTDYGHLGCEADVRTMTDRRCSGRHECQVDIPDKDFERTRPCPVEFIKFFEVEYRCIKVITDSRHSCRDDTAMTLTSDEGHISSIITEEQGVGSIMCPWKISLSPGQRINITLYDFAIPTDLELEKIVDLDSSLCYQYALLTERRLSTTRNTRICSGKERIRHVYLSRGNQMEIRIMPKKNEEVSSQFVLHYEAVGCAYPEPPPWGWLEQDEWGYNTVTVHCNNSQDTWKLVCNGNKWATHGTVSKCPKVASDDSNMISWGNIKLPYSLSIGIIVGLAVIIGVIILLVGLICMEWRKMRNAPQMPADLPPGDAVYKDTSLYAKQPTQMGYQNRQLTTGGAPCRELRDNDYSYVKEMWPAGASGGGHDHRVEPIYQVQNIRNPTLPIQCTSQSDPLSNPYGIESFGPRVNPYGSGGPLPSKGKKSSMTETTEVESDEGQHIYESPDGIRDYNTMSTQCFDGNNKNAHKQSQPKTGNIRSQRI